jgi:hypothetical protein
MPVGDGGDLVELLANATVFGDLRVLKPAAVEYSGPRCCIDQLCNPDSVTVTPAGRFGDVAVLYGRVATAYNDGVGRVLMKRFQAAVRKEFTRVGAYWLGPRAMEWLRAGKRLTIALQSPPQFDLRGGELEVTSPPR